MSDQQQPDPRPNASDRRPYETPAWEEEEVFERAAMLCSKADAGCGGGPVQS